MPGPAGVVRKRQRRKLRLTHVKKRSNKASLNQNEAAARDLIFNAMVAETLSRRDQEAEEAGSEEGEEDSEEEYNEEGSEEEGEGGEGGSQGQRVGHVTSGNYSKSPGTRVLGEVKREEGAECDMEAKTGHLPRLQGTRLPELVVALPGKNQGGVVVVGRAAGHETDELFYDPKREKDQQRVSRRHLKLAYCKEKCAWRAWDLSKQGAFVERVERGETLRLQVPKEETQPGACVPAGQTFCDGYLYDGDVVYLGESVKSKFSSGYTVFALEVKGTGCRVGGGELSAAPSKELQQVGVPVLTVESGFNPAAAKEKEATKAGKGGEGLKPPVAPVSKAQQQQLQPSTPAVPLVVSCKERIMEEFFQALCATEAEDDYASLWRAVDGVQDRLRTARREFDQQKAELGDSHCRLAGATGRALPTGRPGPSGTGRAPAGRATEGSGRPPVGENKYSVRQAWRQIYPGEQDLLHRPPSRDLGTGPPSGAGMAANGRAEGGDARLSGRREEAKGGRAGGSEEDNNPRPTLLDANHASRSKELDRWLSSLEHSRERSRAPMRSGRDTSRNAELLEYELRRYRDPAPNAKLVDVLAERSLAELRARQDPPRFREVSTGNPGLDFPVVSAPLRPPQIYPPGGMYPGRTVSPPDAVALRKEVGAGGRAPTWSYMQERYGDEREPGMLRPSMELLLAAEGRQNAKGEPISLRFQSFLQQQVEKGEEDARLRAKRSRELGRDQAFSSRRRLA